MCGICGQFNFRHDAPVQRRDLEKMTRTMRHRGPDDEGYFVAGPIGLGFRRLSIIDLEGGHQPMSDQEETTWVVFNGEIYNFRELRKELEGFGHVFRTRCDTEVIVHGYKQWGDEILNKLNGMFGLAIWDVRQRRLVLARDAFGIKLVYYRATADSLWFGSEIRPVCATLGEERPEADPEAVSRFCSIDIPLRPIRQCAECTNWPQEPSLWCRMARLKPVDGTTIPQLNLRPRRGQRRPGRNC
jgi:asparagine synthase (glutamine-hydrolysing)